MTICIVRTKNDQLDCENRAQEPLQHVGIPPNASVGGASLSSPCGKTSKLEVSGFIFVEAFLFSGLFPHLQKPAVFFREPPMCRIPVPGTM